MAHSGSWFFRVIQLVCQWGLRRAHRGFLGQGSGLWPVFGREQARHLLPGCNRLCILATWFVAWGCVTGVAVGQTPRVPSPQDAIACSETVVRWVREWQVTDDAPECDGVAIILRLQGQVIAQATATHDRRRNLSLATRTALLRAGRRLPTDRDAVWEERVASIAVSVELAGPMVPIAVRTESDVAAAFSPGIDGVGVRLGEQVRMRFPSQMLPSGEDGLRAARALVSEISGDPVRGLATIEELLEAGYVFYRFRTTHMAQIDPSLGPVFLHRGGRIIAQPEINTASLMRLADGMASHLLRRQWPGTEPYGMMGTLNPVHGTADSSYADPMAQALVVSALWSYATLERVQADRAKAAGDAARSLLRSLAQVSESERGPWETAAEAAASVIALSDVMAESQDLEVELHQLRNKCAARLALAFDVSSGQFASDVPRSAYGMVAIAYVRLSKDQSGAISRASASACVRAAYRNTSADQLLLQMPYLAWAELELTEAGEAPASAAALIELRRQTWKNQLTFETLEPADWDFVGSLVVLGGQAALPNWHSIRPLPWLATMLGHAQLTSGTLIEGEAAAELQRTLALARFAAQLAAGPEAGHMYARPDRSMHGVRAALWDQRMPPEATAVALDGICRLVRAADALAARNEAGKQGP